MNSNEGENRSAVLQWVIVLGVGVLVATVVLGLRLISRLDDGQKVLNAAKPAFTNQSLRADVAGINILSRNVAMADPIVTAQGGGASEIPAVVAYVAKTEHVSQAQALVLIHKDFPHTLALLQALPLSSVTAELPGLETFLEKVLKVTPAELTSALETNFPALAAAITNLPTVTNGWYQIPGIGGLTRFDNTPVTNVPQLAAYFKDDLIPAVGAQQANFQSLDGTSSVSWVAPLLLIIAIVVIVFAAAMIALHLRGHVSRAVAIATATVVPVVGVVVVGLVLALNLIPRVSNGQKLLDGLQPAFTAQRVSSDRAGINMVSAIIKTENPIMTPSGGAAAEVPALIAFVSQKTGLSQAQVVAALQKNFPHVTGLLEALPLSSVTAELPKLTAFLAPAIPAVPRLAQTITNTPAVTSGWNDVPGMDGATDFAGTPIKTVPQVGADFSNDVIPVLETQRANYDHLVSVSKINFIGWLVLIVGIIVIIYGLLMVVLAGGWLAKRPARSPKPAPKPALGAS